MEDLSFQWAAYPLVSVELGFFGAIRSCPYVLSRDKRGNEELHQYTRIETVRSMLTAGAGAGPVPQELWATSASYMNDLEEFEHGKRLFCDALEEWSAGPEGVQVGWAVETMREIAEASDGRNVFCACLSAKADDLNQWRGYADGGRGCCVSYAYEGLVEAVSPTTGWIAYAADDQRALVGRIVRGFLEAVGTLDARGERERLEPLFRRQLGRFLPTVFPFFKHSSFHEEQEFRVVYSPSERSEPLPVHFRTDGSRLIPYVKLGTRTEEGPAALPLTHVMFGPGSKGANNEAALRRLLDTRGLQGVDVKGSAIPFLPTG